ncbi:P-loop containing nucleoside triphosphate hydrolase protein [Elsinoe ampelina]|uniref:P-loop containing nucleoside triphosphate hydrolase protein n=1 Tax=Elsinoe ampelina TaxID=302913 RepID=A0A6A6GFU6_9PEZI|nr:P-loop containing nucleoside triphosphate hydrolase protein [Elsinoe ampelina]
MRPPPSRANTATPTFGRASPADTTTTSVPTKSPARSVSGGTKRKERDFEAEEETNINVVVRCRGRNDREVRENSGVVVSTSGVKGSKVDLSMGPSALSNKTYNFDKVFSPAADQEMVFNEVVSPILDEVVSGFNCTIFAYGQTGTGKTYTMSGDITDMRPLPEAAGIIPRVLYSLFDRLGEDEGESSVKCSFIELYNEELRDLLSQEENAKLKIYDDNSKKGQTTTLVQGMEESHIKSASKGLELLKQGSYRRQVAATKCNDLSSRSHTVFTITVYMKKTSDTGEDFVSAGKLNLVDLAGSENIQRSGAENKRAAEAGLINKSLLTLGRVINALVERSTHIPYRESKLTRLLQDSLGGRTKTCIIATLSPAKSNLEETISTLDYAFRAKNIKNKPQANAMVSKKTMLKEFTTEIEKLKGELMATRQRNGVYLTQEAYEEITTESESRRILSEEQRDKIEIMETSLRNKVQELFTLTNNFSSLKKENESTRMNLDGTQSLLEKTELVLSHTKKHLAEETFVRMSHQATETQLLGVGGELLSTLESTTGDIRGLHAKLRRRSDLQTSNRDAWSDRRTNVVQAVSELDLRIDKLKAQQEQLLLGLCSRMEGFVSDELCELEQSQSFLAQKVEAFQKSQAEVDVQTTKAKDDMNTLLSEIQTLREDVKEKVGAGMQDLTAAAQRISAGISSELEAFHTQLHGSYSSLGRDFKSIFEDVTRQMNEQRSEVQRLQMELAQANEGLVQSQVNSRRSLIEAMTAERETAATERTQLVSQIGALIQSSASAQEARVQSHIDALTSSAISSEATHAAAQTGYTDSMSTWANSSTALVTQLLSSRDSIKTKIKADWSGANATTDNIKATTQAVHGQTLDIVNAQMSAMDHQLGALDEIIARVKAQNETHHAAHSQSLELLGRDVQEGYASIGAHMKSSYDRTQTLHADMSSRTSDLSSTFPALSEAGPVRSALSTIKNDISTHDLTEYQPTGTTPAKQVYTYPTTLPRTSARDDLLDHFHRGAKSPRLSPPSPHRSPTKDTTQPQKNMDVFIDAPPVPASEDDTLPQRGVLSRTSSLRDLDPNRPLSSQPTSAQPTLNLEMPLPTPPAEFSRPTTGGPSPSTSTSTPADGKPEPKGTTKLPTFGRSMTSSSSSSSLPSHLPNPSDKPKAGNDRPAARGKRMTAPLSLLASTVSGLAGLGREGAGAGGGGEKENQLPLAAGTGVAGEKVRGIEGPGAGLVGAGLGQAQGKGQGRERRSGRLRGRGSD